MKKTTLLLSLFLAVSALAFGASQKYYPVSSLEWRRVNEVCHVAGVVGPTSVGPVTKAQLEVALDRAEKKLGSGSTLVAEARSLLGMENTLLSDDLGTLSYLGAINPELYFQSAGDKLSIEKNDPDSDWFLADSKDRAPFLEFLLEGEVGDIFYGRYVMPMRQKQAPRGAGAQYWDDMFHQNLRGVRFAQNFPYDAGVSLGTGSTNLMVARSKLSIGEGYTGNTAVGDNYDYQEFLKASVWTQKFGLYLSLTNFDSSHDVAFGDDMYGLLCSRFSGFKQLRHVVTYEATPVDNLRFSLSMINLLDTDSALDARYFNPMMVLHNMYNYHEEENGILESNNMLSFDLSWAFAKGWNLYGQLTMDQIQVGGESDYYLTHVGYVDPNGFGALLNLSYTREVGDGILNVYGEAVANTPAMYLNEKYYKADGTVGQKRDGFADEPNRGPCWSQDWLLGYKRTEENADDMAFAGYIYGPDCVALAFGGSYEVYGKYALSGRALYLAHGEKGTGTDKDNYTFAGIDTPETVNKLPLQGETVEHTLVLGVEGRYWFSEWLSAQGGVAYSQRWNYRNVEGKTLSNLQLALGLSITTR